MYYRTSCILTLVGLVSATTASAGDKFVVTVSPSRVMRFDGTTGALVDASYCDIDGLLGFGGAFRETREGVFPGNGELLVSDTTLGLIHRFTEDGNVHLGDLAGTAAQSWMAIANDRLWVVEGNMQIVQYDLQTYSIQGITQLTDAHDVYLFNGELLVAERSGLPIRRIDPANGVVVGDFATINGSSSQMSGLASGNLLVAQSGPPAFHVLSPTGAHVSTTAVGFGQPEGIAELASGQYIIATQQGVFRWNPVTSTSAVLHAGPALSVFEAAPPPTFGINYCLANANSSGVVGRLSGVGSDIVALNNCTLVASSLPNNTFGYFIASRTQGFTPNPSGSSGNLCLAGSISRFRQQIQNTGAGSSITIRADLTAFPTPSGTSVAVAAGETWRFQAWHRDAAAGASTSNFTVGLIVFFH